MLNQRQSNFISLMGDFMEKGQIVAHLNSIRDKVVSAGLRSESQVEESEDTDSSGSDDLNKMKNNRFNETRSKSMALYKPHKRNANLN